MESKLFSGAVAGIAAGLVFGVIMQMMTVPAPSGGEMPMIAMVAAVVRSDSVAVGWLYHLLNSAVIGALFALVLGSRVGSYAGGATWGAAWGLVWWVLGALILMPLLLGMPIFAALRMPPMRPVAMGSLVGHLIYGVILGLVYARLQSPARLAHAA